MEEARQLAKSEGVALNQLINVAVAQMIATHKASQYFAQRALRANPERALELLRRPRKGESSGSDDELPETVDFPRGAKQSA